MAQKQLDRPDVGPIGEQVRREGLSFLDGVKKGTFTVPGDGVIDFRPVFKLLDEHGYKGWMVVEAEQDPVANPPLEMARKGHAELLRVMALAGYEVVA